MGASELRCLVRVFKDVLLEYHNACSVSVRRCTLWSISLEYQVYCIYE